MELTSFSSPLLSTGSSASPAVGQDGHDTFLSADVYSRASDIMDQVSYVLQVTGILSNVLNISVLSRRSMRNPTTSFLLALSVLQLGYVVLTLLPALHRLFQPLRVTDAFYLIHGIYIGNYTTVCLRRSMYCLQCLVSAERFLAVWVPLRAKQFLLVRRPRLFIAVTPVVVFAAHIHVTLKLEMFRTTEPRLNGTVYSYRYTEHYRRHPEVFDQLSMAMKMVFVYLTLVTMAGLNLAMIQALKRSASMRKQLSTNIDVETARKREAQLTLTILVSTLIFVALCLPAVTNSLAYNVVPADYGPFHPHNRYLFLFLQKLGSLCFLLAFSTDFLAYVSLSSAYRNTLLRMLRICRLGQRASHSKEAASTTTSQTALSSSSLSSSSLLSSSPSFNRQNPQY